jgi:hypothetical protein
LDPWPDVFKPPPQAIQIVRPYSVWYVSFGQSIHGDIPVLENLPGGHKTERQVQKYVVPHKDDCQIK